MKIKVLSRFIKKIFTNWVLYLGIVPKLYDYIGAYLKWEYELPTWMVQSFIVFAVAYAIYKAYEEEYISRERLEKKLAGPTKYEIKVFLTPIDFKEEKLIAHLKNLKKEAEDKLQTLPKPLVISKYDKQAYALQQVMSSISKTDKSPQQYNEELHQYESSLKSIVNDAGKYEESLISNIKSFEKKFFFIDFFLTNTGVTSDTDINITIKCKNKNKVFEKEQVLQCEMNLSEVFPSMPKEPIQPKTTLDVSFAPHSLDINPSFNVDHLNFESHLDFRKQLTIKAHKCSVTIRDLHVGDKINIFKKELIVMKEDEVDFAITLKSKESTKVLTPIAEIEEIDSRRPLYASENKDK